VGENKGHPDVVAVFSLFPHRGGNIRGDWGNRCRTRGTRFPRGATAPLEYSIGQVYMKRNRFNHLYDVQTFTHPDTGKTRQRVVYTGAWYRTGQGTPSRFTMAARLAVPFVLGAGAWVGYAFTDLPSTHFWLTIPFFMAMPIPLFYLAVAAYRTLCLPASFTQVQREQSIPSARHSAYGLMALCALYVLGTAVLLITGGAGVYWLAEAAWIAAMLLAGTAAYLTALYARKLENVIEMIPDCSVETSPCNTSPQSDKGGISNAQS
jgi:hypothetical protein